MNAKSIALLSLCLFGLEASAQQPAAATQAPANAANKDEAIKGGRLSPRQRAELAKEAAANQNSQTGADFLASNKTKPGVTTLPSGVQYRILKAGAGKKPTDGDTVSVRYQGTFTDGSAFDKVDEKTPTPMRVAGFVPGLKEALTQMPVGSKWEVVVPPQLAYGAKGYRSVGPNAVLIYVIEVVGIN
jgi:FKBP-type peptidyl-prolyl cis-trans isomerase FklB